MKKVTSAIILGLTMLALASCGSDDKKPKAEVPVVPGGETIEATKITDTSKKVVDELTQLTEAELLLVALEEAKKSGAEIAPALTRINEADKIAIKIRLRESIAFSDIQGIANPVSTPLTPSNPELTLIDLIASKIEAAQIAATVLEDAQLMQTEIGAAIVFADSLIDSHAIETLNTVTNFAGQSIEIALWKVEDKTLAGMGDIKMLTFIIENTRPKSMAVDLIRIKTDYIGVDFIEDVLLDENAFFDLKGEKLGKEKRSFTALLDKTRLREGVAPHIFFEFKIKSKDKEEEVVSDFMPIRLEFLN